MTEDFFRKFEQITAPLGFKKGCPLNDIIAINQFTFWDRALVAYSDQLICDIFEENEQD